MHVNIYYYKLEVSVIANFIFKRFLYALFTIAIVVTITFFLIRSIPGDPVERLADDLPEQIRINYSVKYGLDKPLHIQFTTFWKNLIFEQDLGESIAFPGRKVTSTIKMFSPISARLGIQAILIGLSSGLILGLIAALNRNKLADNIVMLIAIIGVSIPSFVVASLLQYFFTVKWILLPTTGWGNFKHTILPSIALSLASLAQYARYMRANCLDVLNQDYIQTAKAKGVGTFRLVRKHIIRNAFLPILTLLGPQLGAIFIGSFVIENIFSIPGLGSYFVSSVSNRDYTMVMGQTIFISVVYIISLVLVDLLYGVVDPRIKLTKSKYRR